MHRLCLFLLLGAGAAPPLVESVENAASRIPASLPGGGVTAGARAVIRGARFGVDASQVRVRVGASDARVLQVRDDEIEVVWPNSAGALAVTVANAVSRPLPVSSEGSAPGLFPADRPLTRGGVLTLTGTGGLTSPATQIFVGARQARTLTRRAAADGREVLTVQWPAGIPSACAQPVTAIGANGLPGNTILVSPAAPAAACPGEAWDQLLARQGPSGLVLLSRSLQGGIITDDAVALFLNRRTPVAWPLPAPGSCALYRTADALDPQSALAPQLAGRLSSQSASEPPLDAGPRLLLSTGNQARALNPRSPGFYSRTMGAAGEPPFLQPGLFRLSSSGGRQVAAFTLTLNAPVPFAARLPVPGSAIVRGEGLSLSWTPATMPPLVVAILSATDRQNRAMVTCVCSAPAAAGRLVMPGWLLRGLPSTATAGLALTALPEQPVTWKAPGLDHAAALSLYLESVSVVLR